MLAKIMDRGRNLGKLKCCARRGRVGLVVLVTGLVLAGCSSAGLSGPTSLANGDTQYIQWATKKSADTKEQRWLTNAKANRALVDIDAKNLTAQFGGAAGFAEMYVPHNLSYMLRVDVVKAQAPTYFEHYEDTVNLGETVAQHEVQVFGEVTCDVFHSLPLSAEAKDNTFTECMRTAKNLTIWIRPLGWKALPEQVAKLTDATWKQVGGDQTEAGSWPVRSGSSAPISLPAGLGARFDAVSNSPGLSQTLPEVQKRVAADVLALRAVYGGAAAATTQYNDESLANPLTVYAVRANSPIPYVRAEVYKGDLIAPVDQELQFGRVTCLVANDLVRVGGSKNDLQPRVQWCMRTGPKLTVWIDRVAGDLRNDPSSVAGMVDETFAKISQTK